MADAPIRALTARRQIKPTSIRCPSAWQPNPGRRSTYRCGDSVQTTGTTSPGRQVVEYFKPFLRHLLRSELSRRTLRKHRDNLWLLGGELILDLHEGPRLRKQPIDWVVREALDD